MSWWAVGECACQEVVQFAKHPTPWSQNSSGVVRGLRIPSDGCFWVLVPGYKRYNQQVFYQDVRNRLKEMLDWLDQKETIFSICLAIFKSLLAEVVPTNLKSASSVFKIQEETRRDSFLIRFSTRGPPGQVGIKDTWGQLGRYWRCLRPTRLVLKLPEVDEVGIEDIWGQPCRHWKYLKSTRSVWKIPEI